MYSKFWTGKTARKLRTNPNALLVAAYLCFGDRATGTGIYHLPLCDIEHHCGLDGERVGAAMQMLTEGDDPFCQYDEEAEIVWVLEAPQFQILEADKERLSIGDNRGGLSILKQLAEFKDHSFYLGFIARWGKRLNIDTSPPEAPSEPLRSQKQKQDQKQDQEQDLKKPLSGQQKKRVKKPHPGEAHRKDLQALSDHHADLFDRKHVKLVLDDNVKRIVKVLESLGRDACFLIQEGHKILETNERFMGWHNAYPPIRMDGKAKRTEPNMEWIERHRAASERRRKDKGGRNWEKEPFA